MVNSPEPFIVFGPKQYIIYSDLQYINPSHDGKYIVDFLAYPLIGIPNENTYPLFIIASAICVSNVRVTSADLIEASVY